MRTIYKNSDGLSVIKVVQEVKYQHSVGKDLKQGLPRLRKLMIMAKQIHYKIMATATAEEPVKIKVLISA